MVVSALEYPEPGILPARANETPATILNLWPEEYLEGWDAPSSRLFLPALAETPLGTHAVVRIAIRGTGIAATVNGPIVAARRIGGSALVPGVFLGLEGRGAAAAAYLERVAKGQPVDWNERDPRYAVAWRLVITGGRGRFWATTVNVSQDGCSVTWPGPTLAVGDEIRVGTSALFGPSMLASVCWAGDPQRAARSAGLRLLLKGRAGRKWRSAVEHAALGGAPLV